MSGDAEEWVKAAMSDDTMVVELLVRLHRAPLTEMPPQPLKADAFQLRWSVHQRRSKSVSVNKMKPASPTTPLAWSGAGAGCATSFSGGSGSVRCEESSRTIPFKLSSTVRSKFGAPNFVLLQTTIIDEKVISKRSRKKKTLTELKVEENSLIKERRELERELAALRNNLETQRATNENLKRLKIELQPSSLSTETTSESTSGQVEPQPTSHHPQQHEQSPTSTESNLVLPDLNIPFNEPLGVS